MNKSDKIPYPKGQIMYTEEGGHMVWGPYFAGFCSAADILFERLKNADVRYKNSRKDSQERQHAMSACEDISHTLAVMLNVVTILKLEPLIFWMTGRMEQEDL